MLRALTSLFFLCIVTASYSQKVPLVNSGSVIENAKVLYDSGKFAEAIKEFHKVSERDTNYVLMLSEAALTHIAAEQYDEVLAVCEKGLAKPSAYNRYFLKYQAIAEDKKGNFDKAVALFQSAIKRYPADYGLLYNLGITYYNNKQYEKAVQTFFKVLSFAPFHTGSHLNLGRISIQQGRKVHGMLSLGIYLSISNSDNQRLVLLNNFLDNQVTDEGSIPLFGENEAEKLDQIIRAKMAMDKNFKSTFPLDAAVVRQFEMFFQQLNSLQANEKDPWMKMYLPIYQHIRNTNMAEPFIYHLVSSSPNTGVKKWISKNDRELKAFFESVNIIIRKQREIVSLENSGYDKPVQAWYFDDNSLSALGNVAAGDTRQGHWKFFYDNHEMSAEGDYTDKGKKTGTWKYYHNDGTLKSVEDYSTGEVTAYNPHGARREHFFLKDDEIHGDVELFYACGALKEQLVFQNGKRHGKGRSYYATGAVQSSYVYVNGELDGAFRSLYADGKLKTEGSYKADELNGSYKSYYPNGKLESEGEYLAGIQVGAWTHYYSNGALMRKGSYNEKGQPVGEWIYYDEAAVLTEKRPFDEEGRWHGVNFHYYDNKLHRADTYKKDILVQSIFYDADGKEIGKYGNPDGTFAARNYFPTGQLHSEGKYRKGKTHGIWKYYNRFGKVISEYNYSDGLLQGEAIDYFPSGEKKYVADYKDNDLHGYFQEFYRNGQVKQEGWFQDGNREQQWYTYHLDGTPETDMYYLRGSLTGPYRSYSPDGKLMSEEMYDEGILADVRNYDKKGNLKTVQKKKDALQSFEERFADKKPAFRFELLCGKYANEFTKWYPDGTPYYSFGFLDGKKNGRYFHNDIGGKPVMEGSYMNDEEQGFWKVFHANGQVNRTGVYRDGMRDSVWSYYFYNGKISSAVRYRRDKSHGVSRYYSPEGEPLLEKMFADGDLLAYRVINENDENAAWQNFSGTGVISVKNANGKVVFEETYKDGVRHGLYRLYFDNGKLCEEYRYDHGDFEGGFAVYYRDGKVFEKGTFKNDELEGKVETFNPDGTPLKVEHFRMGMRDGKAIYYGRSNTRKEITFFDGVIE